MRVRAVVRQTHLWAGLALCILLFVLAVTGSALVYKEAYWRLVYPELRAPASRLGAADHAAAIAAADAHFGDELRSVKMPEPGVGAYHLYLRDGEAFLSADDHRVLDRWRPWERPMGLLFDVHAHLMAGEGGERVGGVAALLGVFMLVTGVVLWWPTRRRFTVANVVPRGLSRGSLLPWHRDLGVVATPILLVLLLTGGGIVFYGAAGVVLNGLFGDRPPPAEPLPPAHGEPAAASADSAVVARVQEAFPGARLVFYYPPREPGAMHRFRLKQGCELHPNGRSYAFADGSGRLVQRTDACGLPPGERGRHAIYPLHAGKAGSRAHKLATFLGGIALAAISLSGALSYLKKLGSTARGGAPFGRADGGDLTARGVGIALTRSDRTHP